jgi:hypothetical protein
LRRKQKDFTVSVLDDFKYDVTVDSPKKKLINNIKLSLDLSILSSLFFSNNPQTKKLQKQMISKTKSKFYIQPSFS